MMGRLLVSEGFESIEDVAYIEIDQLFAIEGFDEDISVELQTRARDYLEAQAAALDARRVELGVTDELVQLDGVTLPMAVKLGEGGVKTVEDLAGMVSDDLRGWWDIKNGEKVREPGILEELNLSAADTDALIMRARVLMGWVEAPVEEADAEGADLETGDGEAGLVEADDTADGQA
jgi:N utilization substance protein A